MGRDRPWGRQGVTQPPSPRLGPTLTTIEHDDLHFSRKDWKITDVRDIASYNWLNRKTATIMIPGKPPAWTPLSEPTKLKEDAGQYFRDQNAARYPSYPFQPAVEAIFETYPGFPTAEVDIVGCGSTLGNLLRFARNIDKKFRFVVQCVGRTVFLIRRENSPTQTIPDVRGYGHTFPEAYTTWDAEVKGSDSHQRIIQYSLGGLNCLVRFEADGYHLDLIAEKSPGEHSTKQGSAAQDERTVDQLLGAFNDSSISSYYSANKALTREIGGGYIPQAAIFDLKTRSIRRKEQDFLGEQLPRLWISQIPNTVLAFHRFGVFEEIQKTDAREMIGKWETEEEDSLRKFVELLNMLVAFARGQPDGQLEVFHDEGSSVLELREVGDNVNKALPEQVEDRWVLNG
ncbi:hypothetical protein BDV38DRAFT_295945 [Aspergillus pseudotamarii]|uniref:Geranylgeranyl pyrophosphate synthetase n=1 Tax=Aspergillus pseudotamarii TaxID=132259 RepID=A0A5N6SKM4_ASPPS|nr:uncharacterized protein BDV38DRAFT_295945 [Aspergillus pseudotamarii]KAE8133684.1 hypothetical protein BDV38DRAFT_295945 [Aspergillus pseudotamarii]